jgi:hypothetical protein
MNALLALLAWLLGIFSPSHATADAVPGIGTSEISVNDSRDIHIINTNPRTVVALEDTHFRPNR